ncbi:MAG: alpha/beta family hydrolase, partial [Parasynechococcus sp.]
MTRQAKTGRQMRPDKLPVLIETYRSIVEAMHRCDQHPLPLLIGGQSIADRIATLV